MAQAIVMHYVPLSNCNLNKDSAHLGVMFVKIKTIFGPRHLGKFDEGKFCEQVLLSLNYKVLGVLDKISN